MRLSAWVGSGGAALVVIGALALAAAGLVAHDGDGLAQATAVEQPESGEEPSGSPTWRDAVILAGGICLAAGFGLLVLAVLSGRAGTR